MGRTVLPRSSSSAAIPCACTACTASSGQHASPSTSGASATSSNDTSSNEASSSISTVAAPRSSWFFSDILPDPSTESTSTSTASAPSASPIRRPNTPGSTRVAPWRAGASSAASSTTTTARDDFGIPASVRAVMDRHTPPELADRILAQVRERFGPRIESSRTDTSITVSRAAESGESPSANRTSSEIVMPSENSMLPPRLGTLVPTLSTELLSDAPPPLEEITRPLLPRTDRTGLRAAYAALTETSLAEPPGRPEDALTSIGRRVAARAESQRNAPVRTMDSHLGDTDYDSSFFSMDALERAQSAIDNSRVALEQARLAIRRTLRDSERWGSRSVHMKPFTDSSPHAISRLERVANLIRQHLQQPDGSTTDTSASHGARSDSEADSTTEEFSLERSLANLRAASVEIDRILASSHIPRITHSPPRLESADSSDEPSDAVESRLQRAARNRISVALAAAGENPASLSHETLRQPVPRRPLRFLRPEATSPRTSTRPRQNSPDFAQNASIAARPSRSQRPATSTSPRTPVNQTEFTPEELRTAEGRRAFRRAHIDALFNRFALIGSASVSDGSNDERRRTPMWPSVMASSAAARENERGAPRGRWIRLDANGDEMEESSDGASPDGQSVGWTWSLSGAMASGTSRAPAEEEEKTSLLPQLPNAMGYASESGESDGASASDSVAFDPYGADVVGR